MTELRRKREALFNSMTKNKIDLRTLPRWLQYVIALTVVAIVTIAAWLVGRNRPIAYWITHYLIPILGVSYIVLFTFVILRRVRKQ
ncbi:MAG: hypothetical protein QOH63_2965 [Acidobacteriota bacterium]|jgi:hypothetical protein|nr:hypothetical protein [Acidobacteriota bacterium]